MRVRFQAQERQQVIRIGNGWVENGVRYFVVYDMKNNREVASCHTHRDAEECAAEMVDSALFSIVD